MTHCKTTLGLMALAALSSAQTPDPQKLLQQVEGRSARFKEISRQIWENPELGWAEFKSSALLKEDLRKAGFRIQENVGGLPTAFLLASTGTYAGCAWITSAPSIRALEAAEAAVNGDSHFIDYIDKHGECFVEGITTQSIWRRIV